MEEKTQEQEIQVKSILLFVKRDYRKNFRNIAKMAKKKGMIIQQEISEACVLIGSIQEDKIDDLLKLNGILGIEEGRPLPQSKEK